MNWSVEYHDERIDTFYRGYSKGSYKLLQEPYCEVCAYPGCTSTTCRWKAVHPTSLERVYAVGSYVSVTAMHESGSSDYLSKHIYYLKTSLYIAEPLGLAIAECMKNRYPELLKADFLVAVPQHKDELHVDYKTGEEFDQAQALTSWVSHSTGIDSLQCLEKTRPESMRGKSLQERREATKDLYKCTEDVTDKWIIVVDDVATSVSNLDSCAEELLKRGAKRVNAFVCGKEYIG